jgi:hypothetical protein
VVGDQRGHALVVAAHPVGAVPAHRDVLTHVGEAVLTLAVAEEVERHTLVVDRRTVVGVTVDRRRVGVAGVGRVGVRAVGVGRRAVGVLAVDGLVR